MKRLLLFFVLFSLKAVAQTPLTPLDYNNRVASYTDTLYALGQEWGTAFNKAFQSGDYSSLKSTADGMNKYIKGAIADLDKMKDLKESKPLRMAMIGFLKFEQDMVEKGFRKFESFTAATPADTVKAAIANLTALSKDENIYLEKVTATQTTYAAQNGFTIEAKQ